MEISGWDTLPHDLLVSVFSLLDIHSVVVGEQVCRNWLRAARTNPVWKGLYLQGRWWPDEEADWRELLKKTYLFAAWQKNLLESVTPMSKCRTCSELMKLVIMGGGGVGKSALTIRFEQGIFVEKYDPTIETAYRKTMELDGNSVYLENLDTCGTEQFLAMRDVYIKSGHGFILVYSVVSRPSLEFLIELQEHILRVRGTDRVPLLLVGNKQDLHAQRQVATGEGEALAQKWGCPFLESSAKTGDQVQDIWNIMCRAVAHTYHPFHETRRPQRRGCPACVLL